MRRTLQKIAWRKVLLTMAALLTVLVLLAWVTPQGRAVTKAALFVAQMVPAIPITPLDWFTREPGYERILPEASGLEGPVEIYRPAGDGPYPAVMLFLGVDPAGPDDPRIGNLGRSLARSGLVTMFYWSPVKMRMRLHPPDVHNLVDAYTYLRSQPYVDRARVGMGGFCVGASFTLMAASQPEIREDVAFVNAFGPYFDARDMLAAVSSGQRFINGDTRAWEVDQLTRTVFVTELLDGLEAAEGDLVRAALLDGDESRLSRVSSGGMAVYRLLAGTHLTEAHGLVEQLPSELLALLDGISPRLHVSGLRARTLVMHDREDALVPAEESRRLVDSLDGSPANVLYTEFSLFRHVDPTRPVGPFTLVVEAGKFARHMYAVFRVIV